MKNREYPSLMPEIDAVLAAEPLVYQPLPSRERPAQTRTQITIRSLKRAVQYLIVGLFSVVGWALSVVLAALLIISAPLWWIWYQVQAWGGDPFAAEHAAAIWPTLLIWGLVVAGILTCVL